MDSNCYNGKQKSLFISLVGETNVGKSSVVNAISNDKISIVTPKPNTTKDLIPVIHTEEEFQFILYDTVGLIKSPSHKNFFCKRSILHIKNSDLVVIVCDIRKIKNDKFLIKIINEVLNLNANILLLVNKIDLVSTEEFNQISNDSSWKHDKVKNFFYISAKTHIKLELLLEYLKSISLNQPWLYSADQITTKSSKFITSEFTRESLLLNLEQEIPHNLRVITDSWKEGEKQIVIHQSIIVHKDSHKKIILGRNGSKIKKISSDSRIKIENLINKKIHLYLYVKLDR